MNVNQLSDLDSHKLRRWSFSGDFGRRFAATFNLQMWCFGCDIRGAEGNLLRSYGFVCYKPPSNTYGSSHYILELGKQTKLHLLGFAIALKVADWGLLLRRYERTPRLFENQPISQGLHRPHQLPHTFSPSHESEQREATRLLMRLAQELYRYETFIEGTASTSFQRLRLSTAPRRSNPLCPIHLRQAWQTLATLAEQNSADMT
jgi:hypothetical protein